MLNQSVLPILVQECGIPGLCIGVQVGYSIEESENACLSQCRITDDCAWYSFDSNGGLCSLTSNCDEIEECISDNCVHGQRECLETPPGKVLSLR